MRVIRIRAIISAVTMMITIYKITNRLNWKIYVGQTHQPIEKRFLQHSKTNSPLGNAMQDCGLENFTLEIIEECETQDKANERERFWIKVLNCKIPNGYNQRNGGAYGCCKNLKSNSDMEKISVGKLLRDRRNELSLTQRQVANQVGVTEATVSRWESGDIKIAGLANALRVPPLLIMGIDDTEHFYKPVNSEELELLDDYREVNAEDRSLVRSMLKRFKIGRGQSVGQGAMAV